MSYALLVRVLLRQGEDVVRRAAAAPGYAAALQRCEACLTAAECRAWLWSGAGEGYQHFCANAAYIDRMRR